MAMDMSAFAGLPEETLRHLMASAAMITEADTVKAQTVTKRRRSPSATRRQSRRRASRLRCGFRS